MVVIAALFACTKSPIRDVKVTLTDVETVARVTWTTKKESDSYVTYGDDWTTDTTSGTEHEALLIGMTPDTEIEFTIHAGDDTLDDTFTTGTPPTHLPIYELEGEAFDSFVVAPFYDPGTVAGPMVLDGEGNNIWYHMDNREMYIPRARIRHDGNGVVYNASDLNGLEDGTAVVWVDWDGTESRVEEVDLLSHDFVEKADGTVVALAFEIRDEVKGNRLVQIAPDGTRTDLWSSWDCFDPDVDINEEMAHGWTFTNSLDYDETTDTYTIGMRNMGSIASVDGATGECNWVFGNVGATIVPDQPLEHQHQFQVLPDDKLLVFDNDGGGDGLSRVIEYSIDGDTATAEWCYQNGMYNLVLGDVHRNAAGETITTWAVDGHIDRVDDAGEFIGSIDNGIGVVIGFTTFPESLTSPTQSPPPAKSSHPEGSGICNEPLPSGTGSVLVSGEGTVVQPDTSYAGTETISLFSNEKELLCAVTYDLTSTATRNDCTNKTYDCYWAFEMVASNPVVDDEADLYCDLVVDSVLGLGSVESIEGMATGYGYSLYLGHAWVLMDLADTGKSNKYDWEPNVVLPDTAYDHKTGEFTYEYTHDDLVYGE